MSLFWTQRISDGNNDAEESGSGRLTGEQGDLYDNPCLFRFTDSPIPPGSTIVACKLTFTARTTSTATSLGVYLGAHDVDNSPQPTEVAGTVSGRVTTTAFSIWSVPAFTDDATYDTPELKTLLQEVVDRAGWATGNAVSFITAYDSGAGTRGVSMADFSTSEAALLTVEYEPPTTSGTLDIQVNASDNDVEEAVSGGTISLSSSKLNGNEGQIVGLRFEDVEIPQAAIITGAHVAIVANGSSGTGASMIMKAIDEDDCAGFTTTPNNLSGRDMVGNVVWTPAAWTNNLQYLSTDISALVQQVVSRPGWTSGNALGILILPDSGAAKGIASYDRNPSQAALLHVTYEEGISTELEEHGEAYATIAADIVTGTVLADVGDSYAIVAAVATEPSTSAQIEAHGEAYATIRTRLSYNLGLSDDSESYVVIEAGYDWIAALADVGAAYAVIAAEPVTVAAITAAEQSETFATIAVETLLGLDVDLAEHGEAYATIAISLSAGKIPVEDLDGAPAMAAYVWQLDSFYKETFGP